MTYIRTDGSTLLRLLNSQRYPRAPYFPVRYQDRSCLGMLNNLCRQNATLMVFPPDHDDNLFPRAQTDADLMYGVSHPLIKVEDDPNRLGSCVLKVDDIAEIFGGSLIDGHHVFTHSKLRSVIGMDIMVCNQVISMGNRVIPRLCVCKKGRIPVAVRSQTRAIAVIDLYGNVPRSIIWYSKVELESIPFSTEWQHDTLVRARSTLSSLARVQTGPAQDFDYYGIGEMPGELRQMSSSVVPFTTGGEIRSSIPPTQHTYGTKVREDQGGSFRIPVNDKDEFGEPSNIALKRVTFAAGSLRPPRKKPEMVIRVLNYVQNLGYWEESEKVYERLYRKFGVRSFAALLDGRDEESIRKPAIEHLKYLFAGSDFQFGAEDASLLVT